MITLASIVTYPIKGASGIVLDEAEITDRGLAHDRRFMLVDEEGRFLSQRSDPRLALARVSFAGDALLVRAPDGAALRVLELPLVPRGEVRRVVVWKSTVDAVDVGRDAAHWFGELLGRRCALVYMPEESHRAVVHHDALLPDLVGFADAYPFLLANEASLADLNRRLGSPPLSMDRFRPNFVVRGAEPWVEDTWGAFRIGDVAFEAVKACSRCPVTTVDQATAAVGKEPLRTLATFRAWDGKVWFAQNVLLRDRARSRRAVKVGARLIVDGVRSAR